MQTVRKHIFCNLILTITLLVGFQLANGQGHNNCVNFSNNWDKIRVTRKKAPNYWLDPKFNVAERKLLIEALKIAVDRIQDKSIWQTVKDSYGFAHPKPKTMTEANVCNNLTTRRNILFHQLSQLTQTKDILGRKQFPKIQLHLRTAMPKKGKTGWVAYAYYNRVRITWDYANRRWKHSGSFSIYMNRHYLKQAGIYQNVNYWAGTIAHEMLHNLGHQHPKASHKNYQKYQINVLANSIRNYGKGFEATAGEIKYAKLDQSSICDGARTLGKNGIDH